MSDYAIRVDKLSKLYRIGKLKSHQNGRNSISRIFVSPFNYLLSTLREPSPDEILWALKEVSFEVKHGEAIGIIGHNGAGKSTLLKILSRITEPTSGIAFINGRVGSLLEVGTGFHPELTGRENIYLNGAILGMKKAEIDRKFDEIVAFAEIEKFIDTPVKRYSSGMYVRLAFAVAAHLEPEIMMVDEVLAVGDAAFQKKCLGKMGDVAKEGRTILFVSHNMAAIKSLCQSAILLEKGRLHRIGMSGDVVSYYLSKEQELGSNGHFWSYSGTAPGNHKAYICSVRIFDQNAELVNQISLENPVVIEVGYRNLTPDLMLNVSISIYNQDDICVLSSPSSTDEVWFKKSHPLGYFVSRAVIPGNTLNQGRYFISALLVENGLHIISDIEKCVSIDMVDLGQERNGWFGTWIGVVRPMLSWQTKYVGPESKT